MTFLTFNCTTTLVTIAFCQIVFNKDISIYLRTTVCA